MTPVGTPSSLQRRARRLLSALIAAVLTAPPAMGNAPATAPAEGIQASPAKPQTAPSRPRSDKKSAAPHAARKLRADDDDLADLNLLQLDVPEVVTAASRREQKTADLPHAVSVITKEDIRQSGARNVPDALRLAPGMDVADISYGNAAAAPRGLNGFVARNTLILVDGRQIFDSAMGGSFVGAWPFELEDIERIEVIRGPAGVTWAPTPSAASSTSLPRTPSISRG